MIRKNENGETEGTITNITSHTSRHLACVHNRISYPRKAHHPGHTVRRHLDILPQCGSRSPFLILRNSGSHSRNTLHILLHGSHNRSHNRSRNHSHKGI